MHTAKGPKNNDGKNHCGFLISMDKQGSSTKCFNTDIDLYVAGKPMFLKKGSGCEEQEFIPFHRCSISRLIMLGPLIIHLNSWAFSVGS